MSLVAISSPGFCASGTRRFGAGKKQSDDQIGRRAANRRLSNHRQRRQPKSALRSAAEDESGRAGYRDRSERFFPDVLAQVFQLPFEAWTSPLMFCSVVICTTHRN